MELHVTSSCHIHAGWPVQYGTCRRRSAAREVSGNPVLIMEYPVSCICGITIHVPEGAAGTQARCSCGRSVAVPRLSELRELARRSPEFPELMIEDLLKEGRLPVDSACLRCGEETDTIYFVLADCERATYGPPGCIVLPITWVTVLFGGGIPGDEARVVRGTRRCLAPSPALVHGLYALDVCRRSLQRSHAPRTGL